MLRTELEILSGKLIQGDLTPIVYDLIKDSPFLDDIFLYSSIEREELGDADEEKVSGYADNNGSRRFAFEDWLANEVQPVPIRGDAEHAKREIRRTTKCQKPRGSSGR